MSAPLFNILRVYLTRPWVWLMGGIALLQAVPAVTLVRSGGMGGTSTIIPTIHTALPVVNRTEQFLDHARRGTLNQISAIDLYDRSDPPFPPGPFRLVVAPKGGLTVESPPDAPLDTRFRSVDDMGLLAHTPNVQYLRADTRSFTTDGLRRLGALDQLEALSLRSASGSDPRSLEEAAVELPQALARLSSLRKLDLTNAFGMRAKVPPLPALEWLALGPSIAIEKDLEELSGNSPQLRTLVVTGYPQMEFTAAMREALGRMPDLRTVYLNEMPDQARLRAELATSLPHLSFPRTTYDSGRIYGGLYLVIGAMLASLVAWVQTQVSFSFPMSITLPRFAPWHFAIPLTVSALLVGGGVALAPWLGIRPLPAFTVLLSASMLSSSSQPASDLKRGGTALTRLVTSWRLALLAVGLLATFLAAPLLDAFYMGEFPLVVAGLIGLEVAAGVHALRRISRQARVLTEMGHTLIPGIVQFEQFTTQMTPAIHRKSRAGGDADNASDRVLERLLSRPRPDLAALLRGGNARMTWLFRGLVILVFATISYTVAGPFRSGTMLDRFRQAVPLVAIQGATMFLAWIFLQWLGRRQSLAGELMRPMSRERFYQGLWKATAVDLGQVIGILVIGGIAYMLFVDTPSLGWLIPLLAMSGLFLLSHAVLIWILTAKRLWIPVMCGVAGASVFTPLVTFAAILQKATRRSEIDASAVQVSIAAAVALNLVGLLLQFWQKRRWAKLELG